MIEQLENELRDALAARAAEVPAGAGRRVRDRDYRPRTRDLRPPAAAGALATAAAAAGLVLIVGLGAGTPPAFAGWRATPTTPASGQIPSAEASCQDRLATMPAPPPGALLRKAVQLPSVKAMKPVLADTRGPFTFVIFADQAFTASCISGPDFTSVSAARAAAAAPAVPAGKVVLSVTSHTARAGHAYSFAEGHTGAGVTDTTLVLDDGTRVQATSDNGWFVAWWPGAGQLVAADVTTAQGTHTQPFDKAPRCPRAPAGDLTTSCASGFTGGQSGSMSLQTTNG